ncbi:MAG TPA: OsmC family protein [Steroidobacteraceae bacterium]|nr:OsmC family protein [Steroidobacteraceae bacterium]
MGTTAGTVTVAAPQLPDITTAAPPEFDGPGGIWSPETLLCAAVVDCFILTFRSVSRAAQYSWLTLECRVEGTLERLEGQAQFTRYASFAKLTVPKGSDTAKARSLLERAEQSCLISNSLRGNRTLETEVLEQSHD